MTEVIEITSLAFASLASDHLAFRCGRRHCRLVGLDGLEPSTSRLSGVRSNHLSYKPLFSLIRYWFASSCYPKPKALTPLSWNWWRWWGSNPWPPACRAGALPAELHPRFRVVSVSKISRSPSSDLWKLNNKSSILASLKTFSSIRLRDPREKISWSP